jgi:hypothetical protein
VAWVRSDVRIGDPKTTDRRDAIKLLEMAFRVSKRRLTRARLQGSGLSLITRPASSRVSAVVIAKTFGGQRPAQDRWLKVHAGQVRVGQIRVRHVGIAKVRTVEARNCFDARQFMMDNYLRFGRIAGTHGTGGMTRARRAVPFLMLGDTTDIRAGTVAYADASRDRDGNLIERVTAFCPRRLAPGRTIASTRGSSARFGRIAGTHGTGGIAGPTRGAVPDARYGWRMRPATGTATSAFCPRRGRAIRTPSRAAGSWRAALNSVPAKRVRRSC